MRKPIMVAIMLVMWTSVLVISYGTHVQVSSAQYKEYLADLRNSLDLGDNQHDYGPGLGVGLAISESWEAVLVFYSFLSFVLSGCFIILSSDVNRAIVLVLPAMVAAIFCSLYAVADLVGVSSDWKWGFYTLSVSKTGWSICVMLITAYLLAKCARSQPPLGPHPLKW